MNKKVLEAATYSLITCGFCVRWFFATK